MADPHPKALQRHAQPCRNDSLSWDELHAHAGTWDRYPPPEATAAPHVCPGCGTPLAPLANYCSRECQRLTLKRSLHHRLTARTDDGDLGGYSFAPPKR